MSNDNADTNTNLHSPPANPEVNTTAIDPQLDGRTLSSFFYDGSANITAATIGATVFSDGGLSSSYLVPPDPSSSPPVADTLPALPPPENGLFTQPMDLDNIIGNYISSFTLDNSSLPDNASFGDLSNDAPLLGSLKRGRLDHQPFVLPLKQQVLQLVDQALLSRTTSPLGGDPDPS